MKAMNRLTLKGFKNSFITLEIKSLMPEKFINLLWKNGVCIRNIRKIDISTFILELQLKDYGLVDKISKKTNTKVKIVHRRGTAFLIIKFRKRVAFLFGICLFVIILYFLSTFIWSIKISGDNTLSPYEIRQQLSKLGIRAGISKKSVNVYELEEKLLKSSENIMWVRIRIEGANLKVTASERQSPPEVLADTEPCNLIADKDGEVVRIYTKAGEATCKPGDIVKKGQVLVKGEQVRAEGSVICRTFYEEIKEVKMEEIKRERTGNKDYDIYINTGKGKLYLKKSTNNYLKYDKIENNKLFLNIVNYYEINEKIIKLDSKKVIEDTINELYLSIKSELKPSIKIVDKITDVKKGDLTEVRVLVIAEEDIAIKEN